MADPIGVSIAFNDDLLEESPTWTRIDTDYVTGWTIDRGKNSELDSFGTGRATITIVDTNGDFDPLNAAGAFYPDCEPRKQVAICLQDPVTEEWSTLFRGMILRWTWSPDGTEKMQTVTIECADMFAYFAQEEVLANGDYGEDVVGGNVVYNEDLTLYACQTRLILVADQCGWPGAGLANSALRDLNTGNVGLQEQIVAPRTSSLDVMMNIAASEFPFGVSNLYMSKSGKLTFQGRYARFNPDTVDYNITRWPVGDQIACDGDANVAPIVAPLEPYRDENDIYTVGMAWPQGINDGDKDAQVYEDTAAISKHGRKTWSVENLLTRTGVGGTTALQECAKFQQYVVDNRSEIQTRVGAITLLTKAPDDPNGPALWATLCGIELSDLVELSTLADWGAGFDQRELYVEGLHYVCEPFRDEYHKVTLTIDTSPAGYFASSPFTEV